MQILYQVKAVFPSPDIAQHSSPNAAFTLAPGVYEYPFEFKVRFTDGLFWAEDWLMVYAVPVQQFLQQPEFNDDQPQHGRTASRSGTGFICAC